MSRKWGYLKKRISDNPTLGTNITKNKIPLKNINHPLNKLSKIVYLSLKIDKLKNKIDDCLAEMTKDNDNFVVVQNTLEQEYRNADSDFNIGEINLDELYFLFDTYSDQHTKLIKKVKAKNKYLMKFLSKSLVILHDNYMKLIMVYIKHGESKKAISKLLSYKKLLNNRLELIPNFKIQEIRYADEDQDKDNYIYNLRSYLLKSSGLSRIHPEKSLDLFLNGLIKYIYQLSQLSSNNQVKQKLVILKIDNLYQSIPVPEYLCQECHNEKLIPKDIISLIKKYNTRLLAGHNHVDGEYSSYNDDIYILDSLIDFLTDIGEFKPDEVELFFKEVINPITCDKSKQGWKLWAINRKIPHLIFSIDEKSQRNLWNYMQILKKQLDSI